MIVDADTGYGNAVNVLRTVRDFQDAGAAGVFLEDQVWPKKCGHFQRASDTEEAPRPDRGQTRAAGRGDLFIVARTDARQPLGLDAAIERCLAYKEAGADALFVEAPQSVEELEQVAAALPRPLVANMIERGVTPHLTRKELEELGFNLIVCPLAALFAAAQAVGGPQRATQRGDHRRRRRPPDGLRRVQALVGLEERYADEARYA